ncbi:MAG: hypothetical protein DMG65_25345 [Candidatus Angelobacter sp. Gp1-AA117]|nr:MAG: hypothetical protein DMG65_25345 [Candidatus Angelobacter sp. Gp1-AA117]
MCRFRSLPGNEVSFAGRNNGWAKSQYCSPKMDLLINGKAVSPLMGPALFLIYVPAFPAGTKCETLDCFPV